MRQSEDKRTHTFRWSISSGGRDGLSLSVSPVIHNTHCFCLSVCYQTPWARTAVWVAERYFAMPLSSLIQGMLLS